MKNVPSLAIVVVMVLVTTCLFPCRALAWNETGHMTVALIAYRRLDEAHRQKVAQILRSHPHYEMFLSKDCPDGVSVDEWAFMRAATWPDWVRPSRPGDRQFKDASITRYHQGPWHYINVPFVPANPMTSMLPRVAPAATMMSSTAAPTTSRSFDPASVPSKEEPNVLTALDHASQQLGAAAADTSAEDRAVALCWLEHLVGDLHQPLHAATLFSVDFPAGDQGGNAEMVRSEGAPIRLHSYWDELLGTSDGYAAIDFLATELQNKPECDPARLPQYKSDTTFASWCDESHALAVGVTYLNGRLRYALARDVESQHIAIDQVPALPPGYAATARAVAEQRVMLAGYRLADQVTSLVKE